MNEKNERPAFCVLGCYPRKSRENFERSDVGHPHELFKRLLLKHVPDARADVVFLADEDVPVPDEAAIGAYAGFLWTGSDLTIYHKEDPRVTRQIDFAETLYAAGAKSFGSCWAIQMAALAAGGSVEKNPKGREWSVARDIRPTKTGRSSPLLAGKPESYDAFIMHLDEVARLPSGVETLAGNGHTRVQAAMISQGSASFWATQYHCEYDFFEMSRLVRARAAALVKEGFFKKEEEVAAYADLLAAVHQDPSSVELRAELEVGDDILDPEIRELEFSNWLDFVFGR